MCARGMPITLLMVAYLAVSGPLPRSDLQCNIQCHNNDSGLEVAHIIAADAPSHVASTAIASHEGSSHTNANYPSSTAFLLSEEVEHVFSRFNFPEPVSPDGSAKRREAGCRNACGSSGQTPFQGFDEDFLNSVLDFDSFLWASRGPSTRCASVEPHDANAADAARQFLCTDIDSKRLICSIMAAASLSQLQDDARKRVQQQSQDLCRPACLIRFVAHYFDIW